MMTKFKSVSVIICVVSETEALKETIKSILSSCGHEDIGEILIVYPDNVTGDCRQAISDIEASVTDVPMISFLQKHPGLGGALIEAFDLAGSSHIICLPADNAIDLSCVPILISNAKEAPDVIFSTSRWLEKDSFFGYNKIKLVLNRFSQKFLCLLYKQNLTDLTNPVQIAPSEVYKNIRWVESGFAILLEMVLKPLRLGYRFVEIPTKCYQNSEGKPKNPILKTVSSYLKLALHVRFMKKSDISRKG